jgi:hypothetical protein
MFGFPIWVARLRPLLGCRIWQIRRVKFKGYEFLEYRKMRPFSDHMSHAIEEAAL